jgi:excisionase family DNA binding protein
MSEIPMLFNVNQVSKIMNVSKSQVYNLINNGKLESVAIGRSRRVTTSQMNRFIENLTAS